MKRSRDRSRDAAMLALKPREGFQGRRVADHARDLPSAGDVFRLPLGGGFRGGHGLGGWRENDAAILLGDGKGAFHIIEPEGHTFFVNPHGLAERGGRQHGRKSGRGVRRDGVGRTFHFCLRVGPIPTMCLPYAVTSDRSTTVRREIAA